MKFLLIIAVIFSFLKMILNECIDINTPTITHYFNQSYNNDCYDYTIQTIDDCCDHFVINNNCVDTYSHCIDYSNFVIDNIHTGCDLHNQSIFNISYTDYCHQFILQIEPYCCKNISTCLGWYTNCATNYTHNTSCTLPTKFTSNHCSNYTINIDPTCCHTFDDHCSQIYNWCIQNSPQNISIYDLFLPKQIGLTIGSTLTTYLNIPILLNCLQMCLTNVHCKSINYINNINYCNLNEHVIGDLIEGNIVSLLDDPNSVYFEKKLNMPYHNTYCNVQKPSYIADGYCDKQGGYNTIECDYDGGDCCKETCILNDFILLCGLGDYHCLDPHVLYPPTLSPTNYPTLSTTLSPTNYPTLSPTNYPTFSPTLSPTNYPTFSPTLSPTLYPTSYPSISPSDSQIENIIKRSESDSDGYKKTITVLIIFVIILSLLCISACIVYVKQKYYANKVYNLKKQKKEQNTKMIVSNPMYDKENISRSNLERYNSVTDNSIFEDDEGGTYDDVEYDNDANYTNETDIVEGYVSD